MEINTLSVVKLNPVSVFEGTAAHIFFISALSKLEKYFVIFFPISIHHKSQKIAGWKHILVSVFVSKSAARSLQKRCSGSSVFLTPSCYLF